VCKECTKSSQRERNKQNRLKQEERNKIVIDKDTPIKNCYRCGRDKYITEFHVGLARCDSCECERGRQYNRDHPEVRQTWTDTHKEQHKQLQAM
jgi:hypothetical protein